MFRYREQRMYCEDADLEEIAREAGTPCYVYSSQSLRDAFRSYDAAFGKAPHLVCYAVKANSTLALLKLLADEGAGFDIVSGGELFRVLRAGGDPARVVFSGVGKTGEEIEYALRNGIRNFNCESEAELSQIDAIAGDLGATANFSLRVNPDVDAATHPYISTGLRDHKFGVDLAAAAGMYGRSRRYANLRASGVSCHIGSQILDYGPILEAAGKVLALIENLQGDGFPIDHVDLGGGLGIAYSAADRAPGIHEFIGALRGRIERDGLTVMIEPGRSIAGAAGVLLTRVIHRKKSPSKEFVIVDAAMNDLIRPSLYKAHHEILPLRNGLGAGAVVDVVGPVCETGDFLARDRELADVGPGDYLAVCSAGAYGFAQSSNYNSRRRAAEVLVDGAAWRVIRDRESYERFDSGRKIVSDDLRYPIGKFAWPKTISAEDRVGWIDRVAGTPGRMRSAVAGLDEARLDTPYREGGWSVRQVVHHVPESHMNSYIRFKLALTEDEPTVKPYNEAAWGRLPDVAGTPVEASLKLLDALHERWVILLQGFGEAEWKRQFRHPEIGVVSLESNLALYAWHGDHHVAHIEALRRRMGW